MNTPRLSPWPLIAIAALGSYRLASADLLPSLAIDKTKITASGLDSGAIMAHQLILTQSSRIQGVGGFGGSAYGCGEGGLTLAQECLKTPDQVSALQLALKAKQRETEKTIDPTANLSKARIYLFQGRKDTTVNPSSVELITSFYMRLLANAPAFKMHVDAHAEHGIPTKDKGADCSAQDPTGLINCGFDGVGDMLNYLYGGTQPIGVAQDQNLKVFDQTQFVGPNSGMSSDAYVYIPAACHQKSCGLHIALHGCRQNPELVNDVFFKQTTYNAWAESNDLVVLYPSTRITAANPDACWDWWGYTSRDFLTKNGMQITAISSMIDRLEGPVAPKIQP